MQASKNIDRSLVGPGAGAVAMLAAVLSPDGAGAQISYPTALTRETISAWLTEAGDLAPEQVVAVTPSAAAAIVSRTPAPEGRTQVLLRAVSLTPAATARSGVMAWQAPLEVDCRAGVVRPGATTGFRSHSRTESLELAPAAPDWRRPTPQTPLESAWRAVCEPGFRPPLAPLVQPARSATSAPPRPAERFARDAVAQAPATLPSPGRGKVQVVSSPDSADARQALARLRARFGPALDGLETHVEPAQVRGQTVYRGVVAGFASREQALALCQTLQRGGQDCLAR